MSMFDDALAGLYKAFAAFPPKEIFGCYHCLDQPQRDLLLQKPLRELTNDDLSQYAFDLFSTVGGIEDFRYFLPRIFDLSSSDISCGPAPPELVVGALSRAEWNDWPAREREAIAAFLRTWLDRWASERLIDIRWGEIDALLCGVARAGLDVTPYLRRLLAPENLLGLRELHALDGEAAARGAEPENFWEDAPENWRRLTDFLTSAEVREHLAAVD
jgi:hypothetical protein